ncbi:hypothetical protein OEZ85_014203 [Tetradesmus obliquus]|uniref:Calponin-homology (CH) domain-containing protein n=1 Tax=Tetradesmus obliquus TaxID=3088 RepID=A0ABY8U7N7_TETOB|nr:hypothetical protein OEZ85_014203 [Tetradesmus obliquus]
MSLDADSESQWQQAKAGEPTSDVTQDETIVNAVLQLQLFCQHPTLDFGTVAVGSRKTLYLKAENSTLLNQHLAAEKVPVQDGFSLSEDPALPGAASLNWSSSVIPHSSVVLPVSWQPSAAGAVSKLLILKLDGKHRLQVKLRLKAPGSAAAAGAAAAAAAAGARPSAAGKLGGPAPLTAAARQEARRMVNSTGAGAAAGGMFSPASPAGGSRLVAADVGSPADETRSVGRGVTAGRQSLAKGPINRSGRPASASAASVAKVPSTARKTFKFYHTELWMNKQDRAFTGWLNHLLLPFTPEYLRAASEGDTSAALSDLRLAARVKGAMLACYRNDQEVHDTMVKVENCIDAGKLRMKPEVVMFEDLVQRRQALDVLMSYNPFWLHIAVEVVAQKAFKPEVAPAAPATPGTPAAAGMRRQPGFSEAMRSFLLRDVLSDPELAAEMDAGKGAAHFNMQQYQAELGSLMLKRFLLLVLLLDRAATVLSGPLRTPLLFRLNCSIKSSKEVVMQFLHGRLVGEGNVGRHLELLGYKLSHSQSPLMEFPFAISNLAVDLRDGLRLIKVAEVLTGADDLLAQSRFPSERRPMQLHNTSVALSALAAAGVPLHALPTSSGLVNLKPEDIVDGDRERTLALLWAASRTLQLGSLLRVTTLRAEVQRVLARVRQSGTRPLVPAAAAAGGRRSDGRGGVLLQAPLGVYMNDELLATLMDWVQAVCRAYDVSVANFTNCFGDGVVLCLLVHYYLPNAIDIGQIYVTKQRKEAAAGPSHRLTNDLGPDSDDQSLLDGAASIATASQLGFGQQQQQQPFGAAPGPPPSVANSVALPNGRDAWNSRGGGASWYAEFDASSFAAAEDPAAEDNRGIAGNFRVVHRAAKALGGVPEMLSSKDFAEHGPDERAVILYVAFLCGRLLECSKDDRAAHIIQRAWRQSRANTAGMGRANLAKWVAAASVIQRCVRGWLFRRRMRQWLAGRVEAAVVLQACWRGRQARAQLEQLAGSCITIQRAWRAVLVQREARRQQAAALIQRCWRAHRVAQADEWMRQFLDNCLEACRALKQARQQKQLAALKLQATWRMVLARRQLAAARAAAATLQAAWRGRQQRLRRQRAAFLAQKRAAVTLQAAVRAWQQRNR